MQVIFTIPDFIHRFVDRSNKIFATAPCDSINDFNTQMAKVGFGLMSGKYILISEDSSNTDENGITPTMFKNLIGKGHPDFSTKQQQYAQEFLLHLFSAFF